jgi:hypothetical protein
LPRASPSAEDLVDGLGCAVRAAVAEGLVPDFRLQSYYRVLDTLAGGDD